MEVSRVCTLQIVQHTVVRAPRRCPVACSSPRVPDLARGARTCDDCGSSIARIGALPSHGSSLQKHRKSGVRYHIIRHRRATASQKHTQRPPLRGSRQAYIAPRPASRLVAAHRLLGAARSWKRGPTHAAVIWMPRPDDPCAVTWNATLIVEIAGTYCRQRSRKLYEAIGGAVSCPTTRDTSHFVPLSLTRRASTSAVASTR